MDTRKIMLVSTDGHSNVYANIGQIKAPISFTAPAIHIANLAYRNSIAYDDIVWSNTINPAMRNAVYSLMGPHMHFDDMYRVELAHGIDPARDIVAYVKAPNRPTAIELVASLIMHNHSIEMYDADATMAPNEPNANNP